MLMFAGATSLAERVFFFNKRNIRAWSASLNGGCF